ncbi:R2-like ligand-binding oxidase [Thermus thermamylovorans]|uniref:R2-like ligand-binding oxidase n=1 Tax=Thermus thermamylovorans TaxID=2509362 RepID=A0A4Q9B730_9DEIN|nr:R2-like ligand-binding oxidase [Thermus thermamylovorans]TBH21566.1 R2-like ligand-binding oxidase [Thermus thermamylovorans]
MRTGFRAVERGLEAGLPLRLYHKAKRRFWDPAALDFREDREVFLRLPPEGQDLLLRLASLFLGGEEAVTLDLLPLVARVAREGRLEDEMYLTTFLLEEAKHVEFFARFLEEVAGREGSLAHYHSPHYRRLFGELLPEAMERLWRDGSPKAQVAAALTYNVVVEGVLAETGYQGFFRLAERLRESGRAMPGTLEGIARVREDESRHIAYGLYLIARHLEADPGLWEVVEGRLGLLLPEAMGVVGELFAAYPGGAPLGLTPEEFFAYASGQLQHRLRILERARALGVRALSGL